MKTEVIMNRDIELRDLHGIFVRQSSKTTFFNANDLLTLYEKAGGPQKRLESYMELRSTKEYMNAIIQDLQNDVKSGELEYGIIQSKKGKYGGTWMHPYLFVDFVMWLSPEFKLTCVKWIYDNLIQFRNSSGDSFKEVNQALFLRDPKKAPAHFEYANEAKMINKLVFGDSAGGQRNTATEEQLARLHTLQKADIQLIKEGKDYYERYDKLKELLRYL